MIEQELLFIRYITDNEPSVKFLAIPSIITDRLDKLDAQTPGASIFSCRASADYQWLVRLGKCLFEMEIRQICVRMPDEQTN